MNADRANLMFVFGVQLAQLLYFWYYSVSTQAIKNFIYMLYYQNHNIV